MKIAVGLSGGVDSAVAALLLKQAGHEVVGVHLYCWPPKSEIEKDGISRDEWIKKNGCHADEDRAAALKTALEIGIPFQVLDFSEEYKERVVDYFYEEYEKGRTPNPDILCNSEIKFGLFLEWAKEKGFEKIATGHYADQVDDGGKEVLRIPKDKHKDQTYFLWKLKEEQLNRVVFPLANYLKKEVRDLADKAGLSVARRPDSQGICFVGEVNIVNFLKRRLSEKMGKVLDTDGNEIGHHKGVWFYTIGERGGWDLFPKVQKELVKAGETPIFYIVSKDAKTNTLVVGRDKETLRKEFEVEDTNLLLPIGKEDLTKVRVRHGGELLNCEIQIVNQKVLVNLQEPQRGIAPGQSAVFYSDKEEVLGGGIIV